MVSHPPRATPAAASHSAPACARASLAREPSPARPARGLAQRRTPAGPARCPHTAPSFAQPLARRLHARLPPSIPSSGESLRGLQKREVGFCPRTRNYGSVSFIACDVICIIYIIGATARYHLLYIIRVRACIASVSDCVRPHMPLYDRVYSPETAYIYQQIVPTLPDTPSASHGTTSRVLVHVAPSV